MKILHHLLASAVCIAVLVATTTTAPVAAKVVDGTNSGTTANDSVSTLPRGPNESDDDGSGPLFGSEESDDESSEVSAPANEVLDGGYASELDSELDSRRLRAAATTPRPTTATPMATTATPKATTAAPKTTPPASTPPQTPKPTPTNSTAVPTNSTAPP
ncbi:hypothetical protein PF011_g1268, partial [Phytophthora fragariae]